MARNLDYLWMQKQKEDERKKREAEEKGEKLPEKNEESADSIFVGSDDIERENTVFSDKRPSEVPPGKDTETPGTGSSEIPLKKTESRPLKKEFSDTDRRNDSGILPVSPPARKETSKPPVKKSPVKTGTLTRHKKSTSGSHLRDFPTDLLNIAKGEFIGFNQTEAMAASYIKAKGLNPSDFDISDELKSAVKNSRTGDTFKSDMSENYRLLVKANVGLMKDVRELLKQNARLEMALSYIIFDRSGFAKRISSLKDIDFTDPSVLMVKKTLDDQHESYMKREKDREGRRIK